MKKQLLTLFLGTMMSLSAFFYPPVVFAAADIDLLIVHINDTHGQIASVTDEKEKLIAIGYDRIAAYKKSLMEDNPNTLLLDSGDTLHGRPIASFRLGEDIVSILNEVGMDAMVPGNHDFDYGYDRLKELESKMNFPLLAANVTTTAGEPAFTPYTVKELNDIKVGIFGLVTPETTYKTNPKGITNLRFTDPIRAAEKSVDALRAQNVDVIVALTHLGIHTKGISSETIARSVKGIDVIIDGHSPTALPEGQMIGKTMVANRGYGDQTFGIVTVNVYDRIVQSKKAALILTADAQKIKPDAKVFEQINAVTTAHQATLGTILGTSDAELDAPSEHNRNIESNLANLLTKAMMDETGAEAAIIHNGTIQKGIPFGEITREQIFKALPFGKYLVTKKLNGADLLATLEHSFSEYPKNPQRFLQVNGMSFILDPEQKPGHRIRDLKIGGVPLKANQEYFVAMSADLAEGHEGYDMLKQATTVSEYATLEELLERYIQKVGSIKGPFPQNIRLSHTGIDILKVPPTPMPTPVPATPVPPSITVPTLTPASPTAQVNEVRYYTVQQGDDLSKIARKFNTTWPILARINHLKNPNVIRPNQKIRLP